MRKVRVYARAESDLLEIWSYSFERWGAAKADEYLDELDDGIQRLASNPEMGARRGYMPGNYSVLFINRHAVYYTLTPTTIHVVRILHGQMDPDRHL